MVSIGKLARAQERYYLDTVARGREDYYLGAGEAPGRWIGEGAPALGLSGEVREQDLVRVLEGLHPATGERLSQRQRAADRVPGFDVTFSAPKSISLLHALAEPQVAREVRQAHDAAVEAALGYLEREAAVARRRSGGELTRLPTSGFTGAAFRHRTSRAGDPALHTHVLVANLVMAEDGHFGAFDATRLYAHAKTAGYLYKAHLRHELTARIGVEWTSVHEGTAEVAGISAEVIRAFSRRRQEIEARLDELGHHSARAAAAATLATRAAKDPAAGAETLIAGWREKAVDLGLGPAEVRDLTRRAQPRELSRDEIRAHITDMVNPRGLTAAQSTFGRREVLRAWCDRLPAGSTVLGLEELADDLLASDQVVPLTLTEQSARRQKRPHTTLEMLATESAVVEGAARRQSAGAGIADPAALTAALTARPTLRPEQREAVERLTTSGHGVEVLIGRAGSGKTFALGAAREAWEASGHAVMGCATAARAARVLTDESGIESQTIARLLAGLGSSGLPHGSVLVVDEAGMVGTRTVARLLDHARMADAKVVLVGDPRQLPEIEAGGALRGIAERQGAIELQDNRRQHEPWERDALDHLREGRALEAVALYREHGRIYTDESAALVRERLVADWWAARRDGEGGVMIAATRADVDDLNTRARRLRADAGELGGPAILVGRRQFTEGDEVMTTRNNRRIGVLNGTRGVITGIDVDQHLLRIRSDAGRDITLPTPYLAGGHLTHAYATTAHKAQGTTTTRAFVLADDAIYREWAYVGLSRGSQENRLYLTDMNAHDRAEPGPALDELTADLSRSRAKVLALDVQTPEGARSGRGAER